MYSPLAYHLALVLHSPFDRYGWPIVTGLFVAIVGLMAIVFLRSELFDIVSRILEKIVIATILLTSVGLGAGAYIDQQKALAQDATSIDLLLQGKARVAQGTSMGPHTFSVLIYQPIRPIAAVTVLGRTVPVVHQDTMNVLLKLAPDQQHQMNTVYQSFASSAAPHGALFDTSYTKSLKKE